MSGERVLVAVAAHLVGRIPAEERFRIYGPKTHNQRLVAVAAHLVRRGLVRESWLML